MRDQYRKEQVCEHTGTYKLMEVQDDGGLNIYGPHYEVHYLVNGRFASARFPTYAIAKAVYELVKESN